MSNSYGQIIQLLKMHKHKKKDYESNPLMRIDKEDYLLQYLVQHIVYQILN